MSCSLTLTALFGAFLFSSAAFAGEKLMVADFERCPNNVEGEVGVYGGGEPDWEAPIHSWFYEPTLPGFSSANVKEGVKSFRLVNAMNPNRATWASFAVDLGPTLDVTVEPKKIKSLDVSSYQHLTFWVKGERGGEKFEVAFRDAKAPNYQSEVTYTPFPDGAPADWSLAKVPLSKFQGKLDLAHLDMVGLHFGQNVGNVKGAVLYVDDFEFTKE